jgi:hypothetical protein
MKNEYESWKKLLKKVKIKNRSVSITNENAILISDTITKTSDE